MAIRLGQYVTAPRPADADLLTRFVATRDDAAFAELVRRHGPAILAVCRRITGNRHDADDAFQVTLLVLARKADRVRPATALGGWLYGVAVRAARKVLARSCRRRDYEVAFGERLEVPQCPVECDPDTVRVVLEEVARLPADQRAAVVLCELEGRPRALAARELGIPEGTLSSRLAAARRRLAARLRDRGQAPAVLAALAGTAAYPVLAAEAVRLGSAPVSPGIEKLMEAVMRPTFGIRFELAVVAVVAIVAIVAVGLSVVGAEPPKTPKTPDPPVEAKQRVDAPAPGGRLLLLKDSGFDVLDPNGKALDSVPLRKDSLIAGSLSSDGKRLAYVVPKTQEAEPGEAEPKVQIVVRDAVGGLFTTTTIIDVEAIQLCWSPDGRTLYASVDEGTDEKHKIAATHRRIDLTARTVEKVDWPAWVWPLEWARDGKSVLVCSYAKAGLLLSLMSPDGKTLTDLSALREEDSSPLMVQARLSPDGRRVLFSDIAEKKEKKWNNRRLYVYDVTTKKRTEVADVPRNAIVHNCCWSPDGKKIAYVWQERHEALDKKAAKGEDFTPEDVETETKMFVIVANADGSEARTVASMKGVNIRDLPFLGIDWR
jgi:RNA polymerase sigma factor (sigma-70 family)